MDWNAWGPIIFQAVILAIALGWQAHRSLKLHAEQVAAHNEQVRAQRAVAVYQAKALKGMGDDLSAQTRLLSAIASNNSCKADVAADRIVAKLGDLKT